LRADQHGRRDGHLHRQRLGRRMDDELGQPARQVIWLP
jgi:hypothetical protein